MSGACESLPRDVVDVVTLLTSELVANAALHGAGPVQLAVTAADDALHVEVHDRSSDLPQARAAGHLDDSGRGLMLVERLASAWGVAPCDVPAGKRVWFDLALDPTRLR